MFLAAPSSRLLAAVLSGLLLAASAHPLQHYYFPAGENNLVARQLATSTADVSSTPRAISSSTLSQSQATTHSRPTSISPSTTPISSRSVTATSTLLATSPLAPETPITSTHISTFSRTSTSTSPTSPSSTATTAMTTSTSRPNNIFSKNSPYYFYAIAVSVVIGIFGFLLLVLLVRFVVQRFTKRPRPEPITTNLGAGAWRYSEDSDADSARRLPSLANTTETRPNMRHKDLHAEMGERRAFLSTEDVALYAPGSLSKTESRYNDDEPEYPTRVRSFSGSSGSQTTTTPFVSRRPGSMSFLHSPVDTRPALVVHPGSEPGHTEEAQQLRRAPEDSAGMPDPASSLLLARATYSDPYRQQTLASGVTDLSRTASTASAYSQLSADLSPPPVPALPAQYAKPTPPQLSPDVSAALASMRVQGASMDSISSNAINTTAPPTEEGTAPPSAAVPRPRPRRAGWSGRTPSSIHGPDLYFGN